MKLLFLLFSVVFSVQILAQNNAPNGWYRLDGQLNAVRFSQNGTTFICGNNGIILRSLDTGITWKQFYCPFDGFLNDIADLGYGKVVAIGENGTIIRSLDSGQTWNFVPSGGLKNLICLLPLQNGGCFAGGENGTLIHSDDFGASWKVVKSKSANAIRSMLADGNWLYALCDGGTVMLSQNNDQDWQTTINSAICSGGYPSNCLAVRIVKNSNDTLMAVLQGYRSISIDKGMSWEHQPIFKKNTMVANFDYSAIPNLIYADTIGNLYKYNTDNGISVACSNPGNEYLMKKFIDIRFLTPLIGIAVGTQKTIFKTTDGGSTWYLLSFLEKQSLSKLQILDENHFFLLGSYLGVYHTINAGATWKQNIPASTDSLFMRYLTYVYFFNKDTGLVMKKNRFYNPKEPSGFIFSYDEGNTFSEIKSGSNVEAMDSPTLVFNDDKTGFCSGYFPTIYKIDSLNSMTRSYYCRTIDGGQTWQNFILHDTVQFRSATQYGSVQIIIGNKQPITIKDSNSQFSFIDRGALIYRTSDNGKTWDKQYFKDISYLEKVAFVDELTAFAIGTSNLTDKIAYGKLLKTSDGGNSWIFTDSLPINTYYNSITFTNNHKTGYLTTSEGTILTTTDAGLTWSKTKVGSITTSLQVVANGTESVLATGTGGFLLKNAPKQTITGIFEDFDASSIAAPVWIYPGYPNPFKDKMHILTSRQSKIVAKNINLRVYSITGEIIDDLSNQLSQSSDGGFFTQQTIDWEPKNISVGMYFVVIQGGGYAKAIPVFYVGE